MNSRWGDTQRALSGLNPSAQLSPKAKRTGSRCAQCGPREVRFAATGIAPGGWARTTANLDHSRWHREKSTLNSLPRGPVGPVHHLRRSQRRCRDRLDKDTLQSEREVIAVTSRLPSRGGSIHTLQVETGAHRQRTPRPPCNSAGRRGVRKSAKGAANTVAYSRLWFRFDGSSSRITTLGPRTSSEEVRAALQRKGQGIDFGLRHFQRVTSGEYGEPEPIGGPAFHDLVAREPSF